jgi:alpha-tubulin suppressor-like RCC1 family protein
MLAQGDKVLESREFKEIKYGSPTLVFENLYFGLECAMAIDSEGQLWGWGYNESHRLGLDDVADNGIHRPLALYPLNGKGFKAK